MMVSIEFVTRRKFGRYIKSTDQHSFGPLTSDGVIPTNNQLVVEDSVKILMFVKIRKYISTIGR